VTPLPEGVHLDLDPSVRTFRDGTVLTGGFPGRLVTLSQEGTRALARLTGGGPLSDADRRLGRRLVTSGMAHPRRAGDGSGGRAAPTVTVVVPVRDRSAALDDCLTALADTAPVVVVDDGSDDPEAVAAVCERHRARLLRRERSGGPGAARNDAITVLDSELVALVDSDCGVSDGWLEALTPMFADPDIGAAAPRVRPQPHRGARSVLARFAEARSPLDMGGAPGEVGPDRKIRYVPTAALVARRTAMAEGFDPDLRVGEDVDLVWRMCDAGWQVRFDPSVTVWHDEPTTWRAWLGRRYRYGTSGAPLARRHPGRLAPVELRAWPSMIVAAGLARRPAVAGALVLASAALTARNVRGRGIPFPVTLRWSGAAAGWTMVGLGRALTTLAAPAVILAVRHRPRWAFAGAVLVLAPPLTDWWKKRPALDPVRWSLSCIVDDLSYGAGVWAGCIRWRSFGPLVPALALRQWAAVTDPALGVTPDVGLRDRAPNRPTSSC
jgi:mycofactocin system glycosyltransferase